MEPNVKPLPSDCLAHVEREESVLCALKETLLQVRDALLRHDMAALGEALVRQAEDVRAAEEIRQQREKVQRQAAAAIAPAAVTLGTLASLFGDEAGKQLLRGRERLRRLHTDVERLNWQNAILVRHGLDFLRHLLVAITGGTTDGSSYGPAGAPREGNFGSFVQARG